MEAPKPTPTPKELFSVGKTNPLLDVTLPSRRGGPCMHAKRQKHSTANEGQSTEAVTPQYRGSALPPDLGKKHIPTMQIVRSSVGGLPPPKFPNFTLPYRIFSSLSKGCKNYHSSHV